MSATLCPDCGRISPEGATAGEIVRCEGGCEVNNRVDMSGRGLADMEAERFARERAATSQLGDTVITLVGNGNRTEQAAFLRRLADVIEGQVRL